MKERIEQAFGKLNLSLDVLGTLPDGYHAMRMIMQSVDLCDTVRIRLREDGDVTVQSDLHYLPCDARNLAFRAARLFLDHVESPLGADIRLTKRIPVGAGMAGGSTDAAAVLRGLNQLLETGLDGPALEQLGQHLGSDVPYCIRGGTALAEGRGERLRPLRPLPPCQILICKPRFSISTPKLFARLDMANCRCHPDTAGLLAALEARSLPDLACRMYNVFEEVLPANYAREVSAIRSAMLEGGALGAIMTGTGSAVFGLFDSREAAEATRRRLRQQYRDCRLCRPQGPIRL